MQRLCTLQCRPPEKDTMSYAFFAVLATLPQIAAAALIPVAATIAVSFIVRSLRRRSSGLPIGLD